MRNQDISEAVETRYRTTMTTHVGIEENAPGGELEYCNGQFNTNRGLGRSKLCVARLEFHLSVKITDKSKLGQ